jgi:hypothetical protein
LRIDALGAQHGAGGQWQEGPLRDCPKRTAVQLA